MEVIITPKRNLSIGMDWKYGVKIDLPLVSISIFNKNYNIFVQKIQEEQQEVIVEPNRRIGFK